MQRSVATDPSVVRVSRVHLGKEILTETEATQSRDVFAVTIGVHLRRWVTRSRFRSLLSTPPVQWENSRISFH